jgi:hypothetical protein
MHTVLSNIEAGVMQAAVLAASFALLSIIVTTIGGTLTVKVRDREMFFAIDPKTSVGVSGGGIRPKASVAADQWGCTFADVMRVGQPVGAE